MCWTRFAYFDAWQLQPIDPTTNTSISREKSGPEPRVTLFFHRSRYPCNLHGLVYFMPFRIRDKHAQDPVFLKFNNLLQKGVAVRTVFDRRLITAIRAFGLALNETTDRDCFVTCITALEALML